MDSNDKIGLSEFDTLCKKLFEQRVKVDEADAALKIEKDLYDDIESKVMSHMELSEIEKHHVKDHGLLFTVNRFTVQVPKALDTKKLLFKHLTEKGIFFEMVSVNSATLNSYYKTEMEAAIARGDVDFKIPGVGEPKHQRTLTMRKEKK